MIFFNSSHFNNNTSFNIFIFIMNTLDGVLFASIPCILWMVFYSSPFPARLRQMLSTVAMPSGNVFVIAAILLERHLQQVANFLIVSLAVADLMVACLVMPLGAVYEARLIAIYLFYSSTLNFCH